MAINFPSSPAVNDLYVYNSITYKWDGTFWSPQIGVIPIVNGGTGQSTQDEGFDALAPSTTRGDLIYMGATDNLRLPKGTLAQVLEQGANDPFWGLPDARKLLNTGSFTAQSLVNFVLTGYTGYRDFQLKASVTSSGNCSICFRTSTNGGSSYDAGAADYSHCVINGQPKAAPNVVGNWVSGTIGVDRIYLGWMDGSTGPADVDVTFCTPGLAQRCVAKGFITSSEALSGVSSRAWCLGMGVRETAADVDAFQMLPDAGATMTGTWSLYGIKG